MTEEQYRAFIVGRQPIHVRILEEAALGLTSEAGEVAQLARKEEYQAQAALDCDVVLELGDIAYYLNLAAMAMGVQMEDVYELNQLKLKERIAGREMDMLTWLRSEPKDKKTSQVINEIREHVQTHRCVPWALD